MRYSTFRTKLKMPAPITTYKHDYIDPRTLKANLNDDKSNKRSKDEPQIAVLTIAEECAIPAKSMKSEWTGIAPMGALICPRIIPDCAAEGHPSTSGCTERPNKFLSNVQNNNPGLYERLKSINQDDLQMQVKANSLKTTYQIDYGHLNEFNTGPLDEEERVKGIFLTPTDQCGTGSMLNDNVAGTGQRRKCPGNLKRTNICIKHCEPKGHWQITAKTRFESEYSGTTSRMGGIILKHNIHDHGKCRSQSICKHPMKI